MNTIRNLDINEDKAVIKPALGDIDIVKSGLFFINRDNNLKKLLNLLLGLVVF